MATKMDKERDRNDDAIHAIMKQNLTIGVYDQDAYDHDAIDLDGEHVDMKSYVSANWHRGSVSYSQPSSPKGNRSLSPVTSVSSLSELSNDSYVGDSESCASLNSVNSTDSALYNALHESAQAVIVENTENITSPALTPLKHRQKSSTPPHTLPKSKSNAKRKKGKHKIAKSISFEQFFLSTSDIKTKKKPKTQKTKRKSRKRRDSKDCLDMTALARLTTKPIQEWSISDVSQWVKLIDNGKYKEYACNFRSKKIDGKKLYKMNRAILQSIEIYHPSVRKAILAALQRLKLQMRRDARKKINIYAKTHEYEKKIKAKQHLRSVSSLPRNAKKRYYVIAVKKQKMDNDTQCLNQSTNKILIPSMNLSHRSSPSPMRKHRRDISDFFGEWEIKHSPSKNINFIGSHILEQTDNFTMIELTNKRIVYAMTKGVKKWNNNDVCTWLNSVAGSCFKRYIPKFKERNTNGFDLLNLSRVQLQNMIKMKDPQMRSRLLREIKLLKRATRPPDRKLKKRKSATNIKDIEASHLRAAKSAHRKSASMYTGLNLKQPSALYKTRSAQTAKTTNDISLHYGARKLGPRDIGRIKYKGTKYEKSMFEYDFLEEKINYHSKTKQFNKRKRKNPVQHKETVNEIGISQDYHKPGYCNDVLRNMKRGSWLQDRPISRRNLELEKLKDTKIPKGSNVSDIHGPIGWQPIEFKYKNDGKEFLEEHFWYDGSGVQFEFGFSRLLNCLSPAKVLKLNKQPSPTGYESKLNWLKMLLKLVSEEAALLRKEDALYVDDVIEVESKETEETNECDVLEVIAQEVKESKPEEMIEDVCITPLVESDSNTEDEVLSPRDLPEQDSNTLRKMYKRSRNRATTTLANSTLNTVKANTVRTRKRTLSRHDINRRRFLSQESVDSIQAIISTIEKKRAGGNVSKVE
eukprot:131894_1